MMRRVLLPLLAVSLMVGGAAGARQDAPSGYAGTWVVKLGMRNFIVLTLEQNGESFSGTLRRPEHFETSDGVRYSKISTGRTAEVVVGAEVSGNRLLIATQDPEKAGEQRREYEMTLEGRDGATVRIPGVPIEPWSFVRSRESEEPVVASDWDPRVAYSPGMDAASDPEMERLFDADQSARQDAASLSEEQWRRIGEQDAERRRRTLELLTEGRLHTSEDFIRAAFVFQHGSTSEDYLLAHTLATVAAGKGDESAAWIAAATLDRYLQSIGQPQVYGTQFRRSEGEAWTQDPFAPNVVPDALRRALGVPSLERQREQLRAWADEAGDAEAERQ